MTASPAPSSHSAVCRRGLARRSGTAARRFGVRTCAAGAEFRPVPLAGYWIPESVELGALVVPCFPPDSCPGGNHSICAVCSEVPQRRAMGRAFRDRSRPPPPAVQGAYTGWACGECASGHFHLNRACTRCDLWTGSWAVTTLILGIGLRVITLVAVTFFVRARARAGTGSGSGPVTTINRCVHRRKSS
jgi:hypothetical protein